MKISPIDFFCGQSLYLKNIKIVWLVQKLQQLIRKKVFFFYTIDMFKVFFVYLQKFKDSPDSTVYVKKKGI